MTDHQAPVDETHYTMVSETDGRRFSLEIIGEHRVLARLDLGGILDHLRGKVDTSLVKIRKIEEGLADVLEWRR